MEAGTEKFTLIVQNGEKNAASEEYLSKTDNTKLEHITSLDSFFKNNINFELNRISTLNLEKCDISEIPHVIQKMPLKELILRFNKLKEVPSCLYSGFNNLEFLDLSHNLIKNFDIEPACSCTIVTLRLNNNEIYNLPHWILTLPCPELAELVYSHNSVADLKSSRQVNLKKLEMRNCCLLDMDFKFLKALKSLEWLDISNETGNCNDKHENRFKELDALFVKAKWKNLKVLVLNNLMISIAPPGIFWINTITELHLVNCDLSWIPEEVKYLKKLEVLDVTHNTICSLPLELCMLPNLTVVKAPFNHISIVGNFTNNLEMLDLYDNYLETPATCTDRIALIDFEQNMFDTATIEDFENYSRKRDKFRQTFECERLIGPVNSESEFLSCNSGCSYISCSESDFESDSEIPQMTNLTEYIQENDVWESWEEEKPKLVIPKADPEVTPSDDEWNGKEDLSKIDKEEGDKSKKYFVDINEDWIFSDVEDMS